MAKEDNAFAVLAHPGHIYKDDWTLMQQNSSRLRAFLQECKAAGLWGLEYYHYYRNLEKMKEINQHILTLCLELGLGNTGGSDYHGDRVTEGVKHNVFETFSFEFNGWKTKEY